MTKIWNATKFKKFFKKIPTDRFCKHAFISDSGRKCALGHLGYDRNGGHEKDCPGIILESLFKKINLNVIRVNNNDSNFVECQYPEEITKQKSIKGRILAALNIAISEGL